MTVFNVFIIGAVFLFDLAVSMVDSEMRAQHLIDGIDGKLMTMMEAVQISSRNNIAEFENNLDNPEKVYDALEHELRLNNRYLGCGIAFVPNYFASQGRWFEPYVKFTDSTRVERKQIGSEQHDYFSQDWYKIGSSLDKDKGYLTDPYFDKEGGGCLLSTYVSPVFDRQGRRVAVYGIDLNLGWLENSITATEHRIKNMERVENDPNDPDDENFFFIQIIDSKGRKFAGSETFDDETIQTILTKDSIEFESVKVKGISYYITSKRIKYSGSTIVVAQHRDFVLMDGYALGAIISFFVIAGGIVMFFFLRYGIRRAINPLHVLSDSAREVAHGNFNTPLPTLKYESEISQLRDSFDIMQQSLKQYVEELKESTAAKASLESELNVAQSIQKSMLPKTFPPFPDRHDIDLYGIQNPAKAVGGDLYDFFIRDEKLFFCIGDVSGKGIPASLVMAVTRTMFRNVANHIEEPSRIVSAINTTICEGNENNMFVTLFAGVLDLQTGHLCYCNAGHNFPYIQETLLPCDSNLPLGVMPDWNFTEQESEMPAGTTIFLYTDGLNEAENACHELFGEQRVTDVITSFKGLPQELIETMMEAVHQFVGDTEQSDDLTMLAIKRIKKS